MTSPRGPHPAGRAGGGADLAHRLTLEPAGDAVYLRPGTVAERHLFGGLLMAQALRAASLTVPEAEHTAHAVHGNFLAAGDGRRPIRYRVERTRDGRSFSARRVEVAQDDDVLFVATVSFHAPEPGPAFQGAPPASPPAPEALPQGRYTSRWFDSRDVPEDWGAGDPAGAPHRRLAWFRARQPLPDDPTLHQQAIVYLSDHGPTRAVRQPHADHPRMQQRMSVSLDHTVWLHAPARADTWLLSEFHPLATRAGRGLALGSLWTADGLLVASVAQEALLRVPG